MIAQKALYKLSKSNEVDILVKIACASSEIEEFLKTLDKKPENLYVIIAAVGAGEYYGNNSRGDYFPEVELLRHHKTFEQGHVFLHHFNKDPEKAIGKILFSSYNEAMHRVELICEIWRNVAPKDLLERIDGGGLVETSMGCRVKSDVCSICAQVARRADEHCDHIKNYAGAYLPDGRRVYAINYEPRFFDISIVNKGADRTSKILQKIACVSCANCGKCGNYPTEDLIEAWEKRAALSKKSDITKQTPTTFSRAMEDKVTALGPEYGKQMRDVVSVLKPRIERITPRLSEGEIRKLAQYPLDEVLSTLNCSFVNLAPPEFQRLVLIKLGMEKLADEFDRKGITFDYTEDDEMEENPLHIQKANIKIANEILDIIEKRSSFPPFIIDRISKYNTKEGFPQNDFDLYKIAVIGTNPVLDKIRMAYKQYRAMPPEHQSPILFYALLAALLGFTLSATGVLSGGVEGVSYDGSYMTPQRYQNYLSKQSDEMEKDASWVNPLMVIGAPLAWYGHAEWQKMRAQQGLPINAPARWAARHPMAATIGTWGLMHAATKKRFPLMKKASTVAETSAPKLSSGFKQTLKDSLMWSAISPGMSLVNLPFTIADFTVFNAGMKGVENAYKKIKQVSKAE